jgi:O-antigen/teichoic acid export membrane protein
MTSGPGGNAGSQRDAADLRRSMRLTLVSYLPRVAYPLLLILVIRLYGAGPFGVFTVVLAILGFIMRACMLGLDKGLLLWIPRQPPPPSAPACAPSCCSPRPSTPPPPCWSAPCSPRGSPAGPSKPEAVTTLRWMAASLVPMALMEVFIQAANARRRIDGQVLIKDGLVQLTFVGLALAFHFADLGSPGLALAHAASVVVGALALAGLFRRLYPGTAWTGPKFIPPPELVRLARPLWLTEVLATAYNRFDVYMMAALSDPATTGMFQAGMQVAQNILAVRGSFDYLVVVLVTESSGDRARTVHGFSYTLRLLATIVAPLTAGILAFAAWILPLIGPSFTQALSSVWILAGFFALHATLGLNQHILIGAGRSAWVPLDTVLAMAVGGLAFAVLVPRLGLDGAALATGLMYATLSTLFITQAPRAVGYWPYDRSLLPLLALCAAAAAVMAGLWLGLASLLGDAARVAGFVGFLAVFLAGLARVRRPEPA